MEEDFKEACALGNISVVLHYLPHIDINHRNPTNGLTALHWACKRDNLAVVKTLVEHRADCNVLDCNGSLPIDLCKPQGECCVYLGSKMGKNIDLITVTPKETPVGTICDSEQFVPNYLKNPSLYKAWGLGLPNSTTKTQSKVEQQDARNIIQPQPHLQGIPNEISIASSILPFNTISTQEYTPTEPKRPRRESILHQLIIRTTFKAGLSITLGAVFISDQDTWHTILLQIKSELGIEQIVSVARLWGAENIPIHELQYSHNAMMHLGAGEDRALEIEVGKQIRT